MLEGLQSLSPLMRLVETDTGYEVATGEAADGGISQALLAFQLAFLAEQSSGGRRLIQLRMTFEGMGQGGEPAEISCQTLDTGRSMTVQNLSVIQGGGLIARAEALTTALEPDEPSAVPSPSMAYPEASSADWPESEWPGWVRGSSTTGMFRYGLEAQMPAATRRALVVLCAGLQVRSSAAINPDVPVSDRRLVRALTHAVTLVDSFDSSASFSVAARVDFVEEKLGFASGQLSDDGSRPVGTFNFRLRR